MPDEIRLLPTPLAGFVGREHELTAVGRRLATARLLTLTGPGGVGKTRLALEAARQVTDEVTLVELGSLTDPGLLAQTVAAALDVTESGEQSVLTRLVNHLRSQRLLLVLDGCEHLVQGCAELVEALLAGAPGLRVMATSREPLGLLGEAVYRVPSLAEADGVALFLARANAEFAGDAAVIANICRRLDGLPLAIELAAARTRLLSVQDIDARLDDRLRLLTSGSRTAPGRQQTLRATLQWSYDLLSEAEQRLLDRLSVFSGGWTLAAAEGVCGGDDIDAGHVLDLLGQLVDRSLAMAVHSDGVRYRLLESVALFSRAQLEERGEAADMATRHARHFVELAERAEADLLGPREPAALAALEADHDNLRAALHHLLATGSAESLRLGAALGLSWFLTSALSEGRAWLTEVLAAPAAQAPTAARAKCLFAAADISLALGDYLTATRQANEALELWRALGDIRQVAAALFLTGTLTRLNGDENEARAQLEAAVRTGHETGYPYYESLALGTLADMANWRGDLVTAIQLGEKARARALEVGRPRVMLHALRALAEAYFERGDFGAARRCLDEGLELLREQSLSAWWFAQELLTAAKVGVAQGDFEGAQAALEDVLTTSRDIGNRAGIAAALEVAAYLALRQQRERRAAVLVASARRLRETLGRELLLPVGARVQAELRGLGGGAQAEALDAEAAIAYAIAGTDDTEQAATLPSDVLTPRELEVARLVARGLSNREVAQRLVLTQKTAANHVGRVFDKLGVHSRIQLVARAAELGLLDRVGN